MPKVDNTPPALKPYLFHGVHLDWQDGKEQVTGDCPFCGKEGKFSVHAKTGLWRCFVCAVGTDRGGGNVQTFLRLLWTESDRNTNGATKTLAKDRGLLFPETLTYWGVVQSNITKDWLVPGYDAFGNLQQLYRYLTNRNGKSTLFPTPGQSHHLHAPTHDPKQATVYVCEGPWDGMVLWESLRCTKRTDQGNLELTASVERSLLADVSVVAIPGCGSVGEPFKKWLPLFAGKKVVLLFDSDHPIEVNGKTVGPVGWSAARRASQIMAAASEPPNEIHVLSWGELGYDANKKNGYDVRDVLTVGHDAASRVDLVGGLLDQIKTIPDDWIFGRTLRARETGGTDLETLGCFDWKTLIDAWRRAMKWTDGLDRALASMLACVTSTKAVGDQLWFKIMGPAACGKSTLCEALSVNRKYVFPKDTITGLFSGFQADAEAVEDMSLAAKIKDKTLTIKDGDTVLQQPNMTQILSQFRALYDRSVRTSYGNKASRDYESLSVTVILCGTSSLRKLDSSELGERFLDCVIMEGIDEELEDEVLWRKANQVSRTIGLEVDGSRDSNHDPDLLKAMQLTGGYVEHLRQNAQRLLCQVEAQPKALQQCINLGKFVAYMRARPSSRQEEATEREFATRLVSQLLRYAHCLAVVLNKKTLDRDVMRRVRQVALDTARGKTLEIVKSMISAGTTGLPFREIRVLTGETELKLAELLRFLRGIGAVSWYQTVIIEGVNAQPKWRLTDRMLKLYNSVMKGDHA